MGEAEYRSNSDSSQAVAPSLNGHTRRWCVSVCEREGERIYALVGVYVSVRASVHAYLSLT